MPDNFLLEHIWYYSLPSCQLPKGKTYSLEILEQPILLARRPTGEVFALKNICPHRGVPLSYGKFDGAEIECPYHGWRFNSTGHCTLIPALTENPQFDLSKFAITTYPTAEHQGGIWIYMHSQKSSPTPPEPPPYVPAFPLTAQPQYLASFHFPCHIDHAVIGLMDPAHVPFVHKTWWWHNQRRLYADSKIFDPSPYGFTMRKHYLKKPNFIYSLLGKNPAVEIIFQLPGVRLETVETEKHTLCNLTVITPINKQETRVTTMFYWTNPLVSVLKPFLIPLVHTFMEQDRQMVIRQQEGLKYNPQLILIKDADIQAIWYFQLKKEYQRAIEENRTFQHPLVGAQVVEWRS
ncbi:MAG: Rieske 2Fe-2S domain-containing protein [Pseudanabaenaceae cyanobacterium]